MLTIRERKPISLFLSLFFPSMSCLFYERHWRIFTGCWLEIVRSKIPWDPVAGYSRNIVLRIISIFTTLLFDKARRVRDTGYDSRLSADCALENHEIPRESALYTKLTVPLVTEPLIDQSEKRAKSSLLVQKL